VIDHGVCRKISFVRDYQDGERHTYDDVGMPASQLAQRARIVSLATDVANQLEIVLPVDSIWREGGLWVIELKPDMPPSEVSAFCSLLGNTLVELDPGIPFSFQIRGQLVVSTMGGEPLPRVQIE
jgi:hypothetical protein